MVIWDVVFEISGNFDFGLYRLRPNLKLVLSDGNIINVKKLRNFEKPQTTLEDITETYFLMKELVKSTYLKPFEIDL